MSKSITHVTQSAVALKLKYTLHNCHQSLDGEQFNNVFYLQLTEHYKIYAQAKEGPVEASVFPRKSPSGRVGYTWVIVALPLEVSGLYASFF